MRPWYARGVSALFAASLVACASSSQKPSAPAAYRGAEAEVAPSMAQPSAAPVPPPLEQSLFARNPQGQLTEEALQKILVSPIELELPARVGVLPILTASDWRGPSPDYAAVPSGAGAFAKAMRSAEAFTLVTEVMPIPSGALGMEALREVAARYKLRYLFLYRQEVSQVAVDDEAPRKLFGPRYQRLETRVSLEVSMFDVKTGLLLFTVREGAAGAKLNGAKSPWAGRDAELTRAIFSAVEALSTESRDAVGSYAAAVKAEDAQRLARSSAPASAG